MGKYWTNKNYKDIASNHSLVKQRVVDYEAQGGEQSDTSPESS